MLEIASGTFLIIIGLIVIIIVNASMAIKWLLSSLWKAISKDE